MDASDLIILKSGNVEQSSELLKRFVETVRLHIVIILIYLNIFNSQNKHTFNLTVLNQSGQWMCLWNSIFQILSSAPSASHAQYYPECLAAVRILSRDKTNINQTTPKQFDCLLNIANIGASNVPSLPVAVSAEALKCMCNMVFQSEKCQAMCLKNAAIEGIVKRLRTYKDHNVEYDLQYFDMKLLFIITGLNPNVRPKLRDDFHGLTYLVETLDLIMRENRTDQMYLSQPNIDLSCEILKVLYNITYRSETTVATEEEEEIQFRRLSVVLHDMLLCKSFNNDSQQELCSNIVNLLTNVPTACFSELVVAVHLTTDGNSQGAQAPTVFDGQDVSVLDVMLNFLRSRLDSSKSVQKTLTEMLSPVLMALVKCVKCVSVQRRYIRSVILPPLKDIHERPEVGNTLRNQLCRLLTSVDSQVRDLVAELLFVICKENGEYIFLVGFFIEFDFLRNQTFGNKFCLNSEWFCIFFLIFGVFYLEII